MLSHSPIYTLYKMAACIRSSDCLKTAITLLITDKRALKREDLSCWIVYGLTLLADICRAAGWATPNTFMRFYNLRVEPVSSRVLGSTNR